jgi:hypothetical protein
MRGLLAGLLFAIVLTAAPQMGEQAPLPRAGSTGQPDSQIPSTQDTSGLPRKDKRQKDESNDKVKTTGKVLRNDGKLIEIESDDTRIIICKITSKTEFSGPDGKLTKDDIEPGAHVRLVAIGDDEHTLTASSVVIENPAEKPKNEVTATIDRAQEDEDGRPIVRRGKPKPKPDADDDNDDITVASAAKPAHMAVASPEPAPTVAPTVETKPKKLIDRAIEAGHDFTNRLPNFICQQITTRYERNNKVDGFRPIDIVTATVSYVDGIEKYENIKVGDRPVKVGMMDLKNGARSTGEFGSILDSLFARQTAAEFTFSRNELFRRTATQVFEFKVSHENSDWSITVGGETIRPGYSGHLWIDKETARVLRFERQADEIPEKFPNDTVEQTIDFEPVLLGSHKVLLPVESKNIACQRGSAYCNRNVIEWRNYRQFGADSTVDFSK